jgi:hypothetical protein
VRLPRAGQDHVADARRSGINSSGVAQTGRRPFFPATQNQECALVGTAREIVKPKRAAKTRRAAMDMRNYAGSAFISVDDLRDGPRQETIAAVALGKFDRPNVTFETGDQFSLNKTNTRTLINAYGPNSQDWIGKTIELCLGTATYNNEDRESVVVRPISPPLTPASKPVEAQTPAPSSPPKPELDDEIPY